MSEDPRPHQQSISHVSVQQGSRAYVGTFSNCRFGNNDESESKSTVPLNLENPAADAVALQKRQNKRPSRVATRSSSPIPTSTASA
jgi:hypothetical protein